MLFKLYLKASRDGLNQKLNFDPSAYRRLNLPLLWLSFIPSFLVDLYFIWQLFTTSANSIPGGEPAYRMWLTGVIFLVFINQALFKGIGFYYYFHIRKLRENSFIILKRGEVVYHDTTMAANRRETIAINEDLVSLPEGKKTFFQTCVHHITRVKKIYRYASGAIEVQGDFECEIMDEIVLKDAFPDTNIKRVTHRCVIPAYFDEIESVYQNLQAMVE